MTLTTQEKIDLSQHRLEKARQLLTDAKMLFGGSSYASSVNRSYYAVLSAARALLVLRGIDPETHEGVKTMLSREFIKPGLLPKSFGETFRNIHARRVDSDYGDYIEIGREEAEDSLNRAAEFVQKAREAMEALIKASGEV